MAPPESKTQSLAGKGDKVISTVNEDGQLKASWWGRPNKPNNEVDAWNIFPWNAVYASWVVVPAYIVFFFFGFSVSFWSLVAFLVLGVALFLPIMAVFLVAWSRICAEQAPLDQSLLTFKDKEFESTWKGSKIPIETLYEAYFAGKVDIDDDLLAVLYKRHRFSTFYLTWNHLVFFLTQFIPELVKHTRIQDVEQVCDHYNRGNDFYGSFLGPMMVYTSGIFHTGHETLEEAQMNKFKLVCNKLHMQQGDHVLDIGCGWGTLMKYMAKEYNADVTGVTLAIEQRKFAHEVFKKHKVSDRARILCMDYRDIPQETNNKQFDKIVCLEMSEHVGVKYYRKFLRQVRAQLKDDGLFFLQIAGLRRPWQYEDLNWGLFMGKYVFPGADASCPLGWVVDQCEVTGWEVHSIETIGIHYSATIKRWYDNWRSNREFIQKKYGDTWYRKWLWFLAWSVISPENGMASCYQLVLHKNQSKFDRKTFIGERLKYDV